MSACLMNPCIEQEDERGHVESPIPEIDKSQYQPAAAGRRTVGPPFPYGSKSLAANPLNGKAKGTLPSPEPSPEMSPQKGPLFGGNFLLTLIIGELGRVNAAFTSNLLCPDGAGCVALGAF